MTEFAPLRSVLLAPPSVTVTKTSNPADQQLRGHPHLSRWQSQAEALGRMLRRFGVAVRWHAGPTVNYPFQRDLFLRTPFGAVLARPGGVRTAEPGYLPHWLPKAPFYVPLGLTFEGADALWLRSGVLALGIGGRTSPSVALLFEDFFSSRGIHVQPITMASAEGGPHLLGLVNPLAGNLAAVRPETPSLLVVYLHTLGYETIEVPSAEAVNGAMNFITLAPKQILMPTGCPESEVLYKSHDVDVFTMDVGEYLQAGGAMACAAGVLKRDGE